MILTVTLNTCIDRALFVPSFELNRTIRVSEEAWGMGGKPMVASWVLRTLGVDSLALGLAAGPTGRKMQHMLAEHGVLPNLIWTEGDTRCSTLVICSDGSGQSTLTPESLIVRPQHLKRLWSRYLRALSTASCVVLGGSLPPGIPPSTYPEYIQAAHQAGVPVIFDASGSGLAAGVSACPAVIKPNRQELEALCGERILGLEDAYRCAARLQQTSGIQVIATLGSEGALAVLEGRTYFIPPIPVEKVVNSAGAGDAILAGLALAFEQRLSLEEGLKLGFAAASAVLLTPGTGLCRAEDARRIISQVQLIHYP